jgi:hypothetical protein
MQVRQRSGDSDNSSDSREHPRVHQISQTQHVYHPSSNDSAKQHQVPGTMYGAASSSVPQSQAIVYNVPIVQAPNIHMVSQASNSTVGGNVPQSTLPGQCAVATQAAPMAATPLTAQSQLPQPAVLSETILHQDIQSRSILTPIPNDLPDVISDTGSQSVSAIPRSSVSETMPNTERIIANVVEDDDDSDDDEEDDVDIADELRKLDEDFQKNLERAKKVFVNRMDNLQRSQIEREAQHLKTLEKHEKERVEFEKRLSQEAEQQQRRIEQLQREWDKKRETVAIQKKKQKDVMSSTTGDQSLDLSQGHLRTVSATSSIFSLSPAMSIHKQPEPYSDSPSER